MLQEQVVNPRLVLLLTLAAWGVGEFLPVAQAGNAPNPPPVPEEAKKVAAAVKVMPGLKAELFASEPMMANPLAFCIDEKGRVWVSESGRYGGTPATADRSLICPISRADVLAGVDELVVVKSFREPTRNSPLALAERLGAHRARRWLTPDGGNAPQYLVNRYAEAIARGEAELVLLAGAEAMDNARRLIRSGRKPEWSIPADTDPDWLYPPREMASPTERAHGLWLAAHVYPLFENALRGHYRRPIDAHQHALGALFARFTEVAATTPGAWFPVRRSAEEIATATPRNRVVGWPYTKFMNAMNQINQSAAILLTSLEHARTLGIDPERLVYLHGCADTTERWYVSDRVNCFSSPAIRVMGERALAMAGRSINEVEHLDLYSCFPCAVEIARDELGIAADDPCQLTVTGGLPFHGGAGNNYVMNAIAAMVERLRAHPGAFGLVTANCGYLSKHAAGVYSTAPVTEAWHRESPAAYQAAIDRLRSPPIADAPAGPAHIETYTVTYGRDGRPERGLVIGRLGDGEEPDAPRFVANTPPDESLLEAMTSEDFLGRRGEVSREGELNEFRPAL